MHTHTETKRTHTHTDSFCCNFVNWISARQILLTFDKFIFIENLFVFI